jgi:oligopeptide/dipeptide ABC transporter ATP-binding protein
MGVKRERIVLKGELPSPINPPPGCTFHPRCPWRFEPCPHVEPAFKPYGATWAACHAVEQGRIEAPVAA